MRFLGTLGSALIIFSALLYGCAFRAPEYCFIFIFIFLVPLFYAVLAQYSLTFWHGVLWGIIVFCVQYYDLFWLFTRHAYGSIKYGALFLFMMYLSLYAGCWFWISSRLCLYAKKNFNRVYLCLIVWHITTCAYFWVMASASLWIFGSMEGLVMSFPLVPLIIIPQLLATVPYIGMYGLLLFLCAVAASMALSMRRRVIFFSMTLLFLTPFLYGFLISKNEQIPDWIGTIGFIKPPLWGDANAWDCAVTIMEQIMSLQKKHTVTVLIGPESTFPYVLNHCPQSLALWSENSLKDSTHMIVGSHRMEDDDKLFNSAYYIHKGRIIQTYDKKHMMPFTEKIPLSWKKIIEKHNLFLHKKREFFSGGASQQTLFRISDTVLLVPCICSELFFMKSKPDHPEALVLALVNDAWFSCHYMKRLLLLTACFKALVWRRPILYVSHAYHAYISHHGFLKNLNV